VTFTGYVGGLAGVVVDAHTLRDAEPEMLIVAGVMVAVTAGEAIGVRVTLPVNPPIALMLIVLVPHVPCAMLNDVGEALMLKSMTLTVTIVECDRTIVVPVIDGVEPVTVTTYVPPLPEHDSVLLPKPPVTVDGLTLQLSPDDGETFRARVTIPVKPFRGRTMMMAEPDVPGVVLIVVGLAEIWKSTTCTFIVDVV